MCSRAPSPGHLSLGITVFRLSLFLPEAGISHPVASHVGLPPTVNLQGTNNFREINLPDNSNIAHDVNTDAESR
jgi:hypothetical protein